MQRPAAQSPVLMFHVEIILSVERIDLRGGLLSPFGNSVNACQRRNELEKWDPCEY